VEQNDGGTVRRAGLDVTNVQQARFACLSGANVPTLARTAVVALSDRVSPLDGPIPPN
jgi:hypothetical protein